MNLTWTEAEKKQLLEALKKYGVGDVAKLAEAIPTKTVGEIKYAMGLYYRRARRDLKKDTKKGEVRKAPIDAWLEFLKRNTPESRAAARDTATALKFIALFEKRVPMNDVVLRECYEYLSEIALGRPPKDISPDSMDFLMTSFAGVAKDMKNEDRTKEMQFIKDLKAADIVEKRNANKKGSTSTNPTLNVLKVPTELLQLNEQE